MFSFMRGGVDFNIRKLFVAVMIFLIAELTFCVPAIYVYFSTMIYSIVQMGTHLTICNYDYFLYVKVLCI